MNFDHHNTELTPVDVSSNIAISTGLNMRSIIKLWQSVVVDLLESIKECEKLKHFFDNSKNQNDFVVLCGLCSFYTVIDWKDDANIEKYKSTILKKIPNGRRKNNMSREQYNFFMSLLSIDKQYSLMWEIINRHDRAQWIIDTTQSNSRELEVNDASINGVTFQNLHFAELIWKYLKDMKVVHNTVDNNIEKVASLISAE